MSKEKLCNQIIQGIAELKCYESSAFYHLSQEVLECAVSREEHKHLLTALNITAQLLKGEQPELNYREYNDQVKFFAAVNYVVRYLQTQKYQRKLQNTPPSFCARTGWATRNYQ